MPPRLFPPLALAASCLAGCIHHSHDDKHLFLSESEPNDGACCADHFGLLEPGDFLAIHGFITDDGFDPFDGFAFTAWEPISVDFRLYADQPGADLDVCLYDPQLGVTVDCFESPFNPETGTAHVFAGGADFHLVVNSFAGDTAYTLELEVFPLFADGAALAAGAVAGAGHATLEKADRSRDFGAYHPAPPPLARRTEPALVLDAGEIVLLDLESGDLGAAFFARTSEGTLVWMGNPEEADAE
jgi:hypothetical protein